MITEKNKIESIKFMKKKIDFTHTNYFIINEESKNLGLMRLKNF